MEREDARAAVAEHWPCGVPLGHSRTCKTPRGKCGIHTEEWHIQRERRAMQAEDDASCIADDARGYCGTVPRAGGAPCKNPRGRCPHHAEENARCNSALDADPTARCWNRRVGRPDFCEYHVDYPDCSVTVKRRVQTRQQAGPPMDEARPWRNRAAVPTGVVGDARGVVLGLHGAPLSLDVPLLRVDAALAPGVVASSAVSERDSAWPVLSDGGARASSRSMRSHSRRLWV